MDPELSKHLEAFFTDWDDPSDRMLDSDLDVEGQDTLTLSDSITINNNVTIDVICSHVSVGLLVDHDKTFPLVGLEYNKLQS